mmetsp:Transcript_27889/g.64107  ORF Transcript_27889/g.64107 Transcript_27889/m.64107 type:complete len:109 (+) Transcript_27889:86-412(+)
MASAAASAKELRLLIDGAAQGNAAAQRRLGHHYKFDNGVVQDQAEEGDAYAQHHLGRCYMTGNGTAHDEVRAARLYRKATKQGLAEAQAALGYCFEKAQAWCRMTRRP